MERQHVIGNFFDEAEEMRKILDACFANTYTDKVNWHYFCDPRLYTYLRTSPHRIFPDELFERFMERLRSWCMSNLGLIPAQEPSLHLMVNGCRLGLHSDFHNGVWGYVYSLTRWDARKFMGGETLLLRDGVPSYKKHHVHGEVLYELIPARFNQLLVFDDRVVHGTPTIEGSMDPLEGRIAMVGHIRATSPFVSGSLRSVDVRKVVLNALPQLRERIRAYRDVQGTVTYKLEVAATGAVESTAVLTDNLVVPGTGYGHSDVVDVVKSAIRQSMTGLKFPATGGKSTVVVPILIPLPDLRPIQLARPHGSNRGAVQEWAAAHLGKIDEPPAVKGFWEGSTFHVLEPIAGSIQIEPEEVRLFFDPPMWVPSQREGFERTLDEWAKLALSLH